MQILYLSLGLFVFFCTVFDIIKTTFSSNGGGKIASAVSRMVWSAFFSAAGKNGRSRLLEYAGPSILVSVLLVWVLGLWSGLFLVLLSDSGSIVKSSDLSMASPLEKFYYAGFTLSTLGVGDYIASNTVWRLVTSVAAFSGLAFITASITYFVPVLSAVGLQSRLSLYISGMGKTPQQILTNSWNGKNFSSFFDSTSDLCQMLMQHTMNHHSYPVIHYFHNSQPKLSITRAVVLLDESHKLLMYSMTEEAGLDELKITLLQTAIDSYLEMMEENYQINASPGATAPVPELSHLANSKIPLKDKSEVIEYFDQKEQKHRKLLTSLLEVDGWSWQDVYPTKSEAGGF